MFYGFSGYAEDLQAWEQAKAEREAWEARAAALQQQWAEYQAAQAAAAADCQARTDRYNRSIASWNAYVPRYEADQANCQRRQQILDALDAGVEDWKRRHGIVGTFTSPPCLSSSQVQQTYRNTCEQATEIRGINGLPSGLGYAYLQADADAGFRNAIDQRTSENIYCVLDDLPLCPGRLPTCEGLSTPGPRPKPPTCSYPRQPPSMSTLGPRPPLPGNPPTPPTTTVPTPPPPVPPPPPPTTRTPPPVTTTPPIVIDTYTPPPEEAPPEEEDGSSSFAMYGILALVLLGGGYLVYRTVK